MGRVEINLEETGIVEDSEKRLDDFSDVLVEKRNSENTVRNENKASARQPKGKTRVNRPKPMFIDTDDRSMNSTH